MTIHILPSAKARMVAWMCIIEAVAEQREILDHRIRCEDPDDEFLETDCGTWCALANALADYLGARRGA